MKTSNNIHKIKQGTIALFVGLLVLGAFGQGAQAEISGASGDEWTWEVTEPVQFTVPYKIRNGGTVNDVAALYELDAELVAAMNGLDPDTVLTRGHVINLPAEHSIEHIVETGESLWEIAQQYSVKPDVLIWENDIEDESFIKAGQTLVIPLRTTKLVISRTDTAKPSRGLIDNFMQWPVLGRISSEYGPRWGKNHRGLDIAAEQGKPVRAVMAGTVKFSGPRGTYGNLVILDHPNGLSTYYAHTSELLVQEGEYVRRGQKIALVGSTGRSTGPHLHFEVRRDGETVNPENLLPAR